LYFTVKLWLEPLAPLFIRFCAVLVNVAYPVVLKGDAIVPPVELFGMVISKTLFTAIVGVGITEPE
jgi:hypothetical protein